MGRVIVGRVIAGVTSCFDEPRAALERPGNSPIDLGAANELFCQAHPPGKHGIFGSGGVQ